jgi:cell division septation protein DedD
MTTDVERGGLDMGAAHEPSYYEIALTNRQVVVAFVILLVCLIAAFFSGVWIGRESSLRAQQQLVQNSAGSPGGPAGADEKGDKAEAPALQEFKFFADTNPNKKPGRGQGPGQGAGETPAPNAAGAASAANAADGSNTAGATPGTSGEGRGASQREAPKTPSREARSSTLAEDLRAGSPPAAGPNGAALSAPAPVPAAPAAASTPPAPRAAATRPSGSSTPDVVRPRPLPDAAAAPASSSATPATVPAAGPAAGGDLVIQVFSSADKAQAEKVRDRLQAAGQKAFLSPIEKGDHVMYRVRVGPFGSRDQAQRVAEQLRREQHLDTWVTPK